MTWPNWETFILSLAHDQAAHRVLVLTAHHGPNQRCIGVLASSFNSIGIMCVRGDFCEGTEAEMIVKAPLFSPADPRPAIARAIINILEEVAIPQSSEANPKMKRKPRYVH